MSHPRPSVAVTAFARVTCACGAALIGMAEPALATSCLPVPLVSLARQSPAIVEATVQAVAAFDVDRRPVPPGVSPPPDLNPMVVATLADVQPLRGTRVDRLLASPGMLVPGQRYIFITHASLRPWLVAIGGCGGIARPTTYAAELRRWIASLDAAPAGGRVVGAVLLRRWGDPDPGGTPFQAVEGARITLRGPVSWETTTGARGEYAFTGLPDGDYTLAVQPPAGPMVADAPFVLHASLSGGHAAAIVDAFVAVEGVITGRVRDEHQQPVAGAKVYLHVGPSVGAPEDHAFAFARTGADGAYVFRHVPPGRYVATLDDAYLPAYASFPATGAREIVMGWAETVDLAPLEGVKATEILVDGHVVDAQGRAAEIGFRVEIVGPLGVYPKSGTDEGTDADGRFTLRFVPGLRYRFTFHTAAGTPHVVERLVSGDDLHFVVPSP